MLYTPSLLRTAGGFAAGSALRRLLIVPLMLGLVIGFATMHAGAGSAAAQTNLVTVTCTTGSPVTCTITLNASVAPGSSFTATLANGSVVTISCSNGCAAGSQYTVTQQGTTYTAPQLVVQTPQPVYPTPQYVSYGLAPGQCVNSVPTAIGCTSISSGIGYPGYAYPQAYPSYPLYSPGFFNGCTTFGIAGCNNNCLTFGIAGCNNNNNCFTINSFCNFRNRCFPVTTLVFPGRIC